MKIQKNITHLIIMLATLGLSVIPSLNAQTYTNFYNFTVPDPDTGFSSDGANPLGGLISNGKRLYGTTYNGGAFGVGTVFGVNKDGTCFTNLHSFSGSGSNPSSEGANPIGSLILSGNTLYGTTIYGGLGIGTVFKLNTDGTGFTNIYAFTGGQDEGHPNSGVILSSNILYGATSISPGTVFKVNTDGTGFTNVYAFTGTGNDGNLPSSLILSSNTLYGTTPSGGTFNLGTVFAVNTDGSGFTNLYSFTQSFGFGSGARGTNSDGATPQAGLILSGNRLYGTASNGGTNGFGTVFAVNTDGSGFTALYTFTEPQGFFSSTNSDGANPMTALILSGNTLYGTAIAGGTFGEGYGTVFAVNTDGSGFVNLHSFDYPSGIIPQGSVILIGNTLYGTASEGCNSTNSPYDPYFDGSGTVFSISLPPPQLSITLSGANVILAWPTNATYFTLQSTTNLASPAWINVNGQNMVTNTIVGSKMFYRLNQLPP